MIKIKINLTNLKWSSKFNKGNLKIENDKLTIGHLMFKIRMLLSAIDSAEAIFLFINNQYLCCNSDILIHVHNKYAIDDILHITVTRENVFGQKS